MTTAEIAALGTAVNPRLIKASDGGFYAIAAGASGASAQPVGTDAALITTDVTTNNASTSKHGFLPKLDNNNSHFLDGTGAWSTPAGGGSIASTTTLLKGDGSGGAAATGIAISGTSPNTKLTWSPNASFEFMRVNRPVSFTGGMPFVWLIENVSNGDGTYNSPMKWGWNPDGAVDATQQGIHYSLEPSYTAGKWMEAHLEVYLPNGDTSRLSSATFQTGATMAASTCVWSWNATTYQWNQMTGTAFASMTFNGGFNLYGADNSGLNLLCTTGTSYLRAANSTASQTLFLDAWTDVRVTSATAANAFVVSGTNTIRTSIYATNANTLGNTSLYLENNRGSFASYGGQLYGGATYPYSHFGVTGADKYMIFADGASNLGMALGTVTSQPLIFGTSDAERMRISGAGGVSIGTTTDPGAGKLKVVNNFVGTVSAGVPASTGATGTAGTVAFDTDYIYICTASNTWKRAAIATW